ncbi:MAG: hypothetical protein ACLQQ4_16545 [Bacteroidia bacterium]
MKKINTNLTYLLQIKLKATLTWKNSKKLNRVSFYRTTSHVISSLHKDRPSSPFYTNIFLIIILTKRQIILSAIWRQNFNKEK